MDLICINSAHSHNVYKIKTKAVYSNCWINRACRLCRSTLVSESLMKMPSIRQTWETRESNTTLPLLSFTRMKDASHTNYYFCFLSVDFTITYFWVPGNWFFKHWITISLLADLLFVAAWFNLAYLKMNEVYTCICKMITIIQLTQQCQIILGNNIYAV